jgi:amidase
MPGATTSPDMVTGTRAAVTALRDAGATLEEAAPPRLEESMPITVAYWARTSSLSLTEWQPYRESTLTADEIERSIFEWERFRASMLRFMESYDVIVCPTAPYVAPAHRELPPGDYVYTLPYSLTGYPVAVVRAGTSSSGMPVGLQVVARPWHDHVALAAASIIEQTTGGWQIAHLAE